MFTHSRAGYLASVTTVRKLGSAERKGSGMRKRLISLGLVTVLAFGSVGMAGCDKEDRQDVRDVTNDDKD